MARQSGAIAAIDRSIGSNEIALQRVVVDEISAEARRRQKKYLVLITIWSLDLSD
jgi:hypothetical protein